MYSQIIIDDILLPTVLLVVYLMLQGVLDNNYGWDENNDLDEQFHLAHKAGDEKRLMQFHQELEDVIEVQYSTEQNMKSHREIRYWEAHARLLFGSHETSPIIWIGKPTSAIHC